jgi:hypothetical protein
MYLLYATTACWQVMVRCSNCAAAMVKLALLPNAMCYACTCRFDELLLLKRGGRTIFHGALGTDSNLLIDYFTQTPGGHDDDSTDDVARAQSKHVP